MMIFEKLKAFVASRYFVFLLFALYLFACLYKLNRQGASKDELTTYGNMLMDMRTMIVNRLERGHVPFYFIGLKSWTLIFGKSYTSMILFSSALGWLCLWGIAALARKLGWGRFGWALAAMMAVHPTFIHFARYARPWMGVACLAVWILFIWVSLFELPPGKRRTRLLACWCALAIVGAGWNHTLASVWGVLALGTLLSPTLRRRCSDAIGLGIAFGLFSHVFMTGLTMSNGRGMKPVAWIPHLTPSAMYNLMDDWFGGMLNDRVAPKIADVLPVLFFGLCIYGAWRLYIRRHPRHVFPLSAEQTAMWRVVAAAGWLPMLVLVASNYSPQPFMVFRYGFPAFPGLILLAGYGAWMFPVRYARIGLLTLWLVSSVAAYGPFLELRRTGMRDCLRELARSLRPDYKEVVLTTPGHGFHALQLFVPEAEVVLTAPTLPLKQAWPMLNDIAGKVDRIWIFQIWDQRGLATAPDWNEKMGPPDFRIRRPGCKLLRYDYIGSGLHTRADQMPSSQSLPMHGFNPSMEYNFDEPEVKEAVEQAHSEDSSDDAPQD